MIIQMAARILREKAFDDVRSDDSDDDFCSSGQSEKVNLNGNGLTIK